MTRRKWNRLKRQRPELFKQGMHPLDEIGMRQMSKKQVISLLSIRVLGKESEGGQVVYNAGRSPVAMFFEEIC